MAGLDPAIHVFARSVSDEAIQSQFKLDCFAALAMTRSGLPAMQTHPGHSKFSPSEKRGHRECRAFSDTRSLVCKNRKHTSSSPQVRRNSPAFPARWFTTYFVLSLVIGLCVTIAREVLSTVANLTSASRCQDHTTSPSEISASSVASTSAIASRVQRVVTIAIRPSSRARDGPACRDDLPVG